MGVIIFKGGKIIEKKVFTGTRKDVQSTLDKMLVLDPLLSFQLFDDEKDPLFTNVNVDPSLIIPSPQQQLNALWEGGQAEADMRLRMRAITPAPISITKS